MNKVYQLNKLIQDEMEEALELSEMGELPNSDAEPDENPFEYMLEGYQTAQGDIYA